MDNYYTKAKAVFQSKTGKQFTHEVIYKVLSKLPKYEIEITNIDSRVLCRTLSLLDVDNNAHNNECDAVGAMSPAAITGLSMEVLLTTAGSSDSNKTPLASGHILTDLTRTAQSSDKAAHVPRIQGAGGIPQPTIGKKKAK